MYQVAVVRHRSLFASPRILALVSLVALAACGKKSIGGPGTTPPTADAAPVDTELDARLVALEGALEKARVDHHVPGMAIAVVKDGEVVLARGFGMADLQARRAADEHTVFSIGSSTKAFTSTVVGMLVDEGKLKWDDPVSKYVPELELPIDDDGKPTKATLRDAMSHQTGFTRMSLLWIAGAVDSKEMYTRASTAEPLAKYRTQFLYNNVVYASAGEASARVAGMSWEDLVDARIFDPLGMTATTADQTAAGSNPARAQGYRYEEETDEFTAVPMRPIPVAAPAGAIYSNAEDMAKWVQFQLADGQVDGKRLISHEALAQTRAPQIQMAPNMSYGLGWMLALYDGKKVIHHGGNIDGYAAMVAMIPEAKLGYVLLTNTTSTPLQNASMGIVFDAMLGERSGDGKANAGGKAEDMTPYLGKFVADFGPFNDADFTVTEKDGVMFVDVPGQTNYELRPPAEDGKREFALTNTIKVSFERDDAGKVVAMRLHQGGFDFECLRRGYVPEPAIPLAQLDPMLGTYEHEKLGKAEVRISNNRLTVEIAGQPKLELDPPDAEGKRPVRIKAGTTVQFIPGSGKPEKFLIHEQTQEAEFVRVGGAKAAKALPTVDAIIKLRKRALAKQPLRTTAKVRVPSSAVEGTVEWIFMPDGRTATHTDFGKFGTAEEVVAADSAWSKASFAPLEVYAGKYLDQAQAGLPVLLFGDWKTAFDAIDVERETEVDGRRAWVVNLTRGKAPTIVATVDAKTGDILEVRQNVVQPGAGGIPTKTKLDAYKVVAGVRVPHVIERRDEPSGRTVLEVQTVEVFSGDEAEAFPPPPNKK